MSGGETTSQGPAGDGGPAPTASDLAREIRVLGRLSVTDLRTRFAAAWGRPATSRNREYLIRAVARRLAPDLSERAIARSLATALRPPPAPTPFRHDPRVPPVGSVLRHGAGDDVVEVQVTRTGFLWRGRTYRSLSRIATEASGGTAWNGYVYFGITKRIRRPPPWRQT